MLSPEQRKAAELLSTRDVNGYTLAEVAEEVGVSDRTLYRWKQDPEFIGYQNELADLFMEEFIAEAYTELRQMIRTADGKLKLSALELVLKNRGKLKQDTDVTVKVATKSDEDIQREIDDMLKRTNL